MAFFVHVMFISILYKFGSRVIYFSFSSVFSFVWSGFAWLDSLSSSFCCTAHSSFTACFMRVQWFETSKSVCDNTWYPIVRLGYPAITNIFAVNQIIRYNTITNISFGTVPLPYSRVPL